MSEDPVRALRRHGDTKKRARSHPNYLQALMAGKAPTPQSFCIALDSGLDGDEALTRAANLDTAAQRFANEHWQQHPDQLPPDAA